MIKQQSHTLQKNKNNIRCLSYLISFKYHIVPYFPNKLVSFFEHIDFFGGFIINIKTVS